MNTLFLIYLECKYQSLLLNYSVAYATSSEFYVGPKLLPYLYNYLSFPNLWFSDHVIDRLVEVWANDFYQIITSSNRSRIE
jgi:hypothetical protein